jgi:hypothetical protein
MARRHCRPVADKKIHAIFSHCAGLMGIRRSVALLAADGEITKTMTWGC